MLQNTKTLRRVGGGAAVVTVAGLLPLFAASAASAVTGVNFSVSPTTPMATSQATVSFTTVTALSSTNNTITIKPTTTPTPGFTLPTTAGAYTVNGVQPTSVAPTTVGTPDGAVTLTLAPSTAGAAGTTVTVVATGSTNPTAAGSSTSVAVSTTAEPTPSNSNSQTFAGTAGTSPTVTQVSPVAVNTSGTPVTITGTNFATTGNNTVTFQPVGQTAGGVTTTGTSSDGSTITVTSPNTLTDGTSYDVIVNNGTANTSPSATSAADQIKARTNLAFIPLVPTRALDTRAGFGGPRGQVQPGQSISFALPSTVPAGATAIAVNVTSVTPTGPGNAVVFQTGATPPATSSVNFIPNGTDATGNFSLVPVTGTNRSLTIRVGTGTGAGASDFTADVTGYFTNGFVAPANATGRVLDTRPAPNRTGNLQGPLNGRTTFLVTLTGVPTDATAVAVNSTAINPTQVGNLQVFPTSGAPGDIATVQYVPGLDTGSFSVVPITPDAQGNASVNLYSDSSGTVNVAIDVTGYLNQDNMTTGGKNTFTPVNKPGRVLDTRQAGGPITPGAPRSANVEGRSFGTTAVTTGQATSAMVSVASVLPKGVGNLRGFPTGSPVPNAATINYFPNQSRENFAIVAVRNGSLDLAADGVPSDATVDVLGIF